MYQLADAAANNALYLSITDTRMTRKAPTRGRADHFAADIT